MERDKSSKRLLHFFSVLSLLIIINALGTYLIYKLMNLHTAENYGQIMIGIGSLYVLFEFGIAGGTGNRSIYQRVDLRNKLLYGAHDGDRVDRNYGFSLCGVLAGSITIVIGALIIILFN